MSIGLTEKSLRDARFRKTEEAIFKAFFDEKDRKKLSVDELVCRVGIDRATFYRHHRAIYEIVEDYKKYILEKYTRLMSSIRKRGGVNLRKLYYEMLIFILQNRKVFEMLMEEKEFGVLSEMVLVLELNVAEYMKILGDSERILRVYIGGITGLLVDWGLNGFCEVEMVEILNNLMYLTETVKNEFNIRGLALGGCKC